VRKLINTVWIWEGGMEIWPESEGMAQLVSTKLKKKAGMCLAMITLN